MSTEEMLVYLIERGKLTLDQVAKKYQTEVKKLLSEKEKQEE